MSGDDERVQMSRELKLLSIQNEDPRLRTRSAQNPTNLRDQIDNGKVNGTRNNLAYRMAYVSWFLFSWLLDPGLPPLRSLTLLDQPLSVGIPWSSVRSD